MKRYNIPDTHKLGQILMVTGIRSLRYNMGRSGFGHNLKIQPAFVGELSETHC